jgi:hypothetical protein
MQYRVTLATLFALVALLGLGLATRAEEKPKKVGKIDGKVNFEGKPLPGGTVSFHPEKGKPFVAQLQDDGTYSVKDVPVGEMKVTIETESLKNPAKPPKGGKKYIPIPRKYGDPKTSDLTYKVVEGAQTLDIELK